MKQIILASLSIYRKQQLEQLNISFSTAIPDIDEDAWKTKGLDHIQLSRELALLKARKISRLYDDAIVIGGDQIASFNQTIYSKPKSKEKAFKQLKTMAGNEHKLMTSVAIIANDQEYIHTCIAHMKMRQLTEAQILRYIDIDEPLNSCGSYRLEALGISLFDRIECDDYTSIIGLPLMWVAQTLSELGVSVP